MNKDFWDSRYNEEQYAYGTEPNALFKQELDLLPKGKILFAAEGEGRNAVYAAQQGWEVDAFDMSESGKNKALALAKTKHVTMNYKVCTFQDFESKNEAYDCIAYIFSHIPADIRQNCFRKLLPYLKPQGKVIVVGFSSAQLGKSSGGPKDIEMLFSKTQLEEDFKELNHISIEEVEQVLDEGAYHAGQASLIKMVGFCDKKTNNTGYDKRRTDI